MIKNAEIKALSTTFAIALNTSNQGLVHLITDNLVTWAVEAHQGLRVVEDELTLFRAANAYVGLAEVFGMPYEPEAFSHMPCKAVLVKARLNLFCQYIKQVDKGQEVDIHA